MKSNPSPSLRRALHCALLFGLLPAAGRLSAAPSEDVFFGRWALTIPNGRAGWLEIKPEKNWYEGSILWGGGSVLPLASVVIADGTLTVTRITEVERKTGAVARTQQLTETITAQADGDVLKLVRVAPRADGRGFERAGFTGRRLPALPPRPDLAKVRFGGPVALLNGQDLAGWRLVDPQMANGWRMESGILANDPVQVEGQPRKRYGNLRTEREFEDFNLQLEVRVPRKSNSGVYLRGLYEVQVFDSFGKPLDSHNMGAIYSRITPSSSAEKPAGEWQTYDITLCDRHITVILNGKTIIDNQPVLGCTGGALTSDEFKPGPLYLQGDHTAVSYRNIVLKPIVK